jgi:hypothetical protein
MQSIEDIIAEKRRRLASLEKDRLVELLAGFWITIEMLLEDDPSNAARKTKSNGRTSNNLKLTKAWTAILRRLCTYKHFRASDIILISREFQKNGEVDRIQTPGGTRAQLSHLTKKGIIKRLGGGNYRISDQAKTDLTRSGR